MKDKGKKILVVLLAVVLVSCSVIGAGIYRSRVQASNDARKELVDEITEKCKEEVIESVREVSEDGDEYRLINETIESGAMDDVIKDAVCDYLDGEFYYEDDRFDESKDGNTEGGDRSDIYNDAGPWSDQPRGGEKAETQGRYYGGGETVEIQEQYSGDGEVAEMQERYSDGRDVVVEEDRYIEPSAEGVLKHNNDEYKKYSDKLYKEIKEYLEKTLSNRENITSAEVERISKAAADEMAKRITDSIRVLQNVCDEDIEAAIKKSNQYADSAVNTLGGNTEKKLNELSGKTDKKLDELSGNTEKSINELSGNTDKKLSELNGATDKKLEELDGSTNKKLSELSGDTDKKLSELSSDTNKRIEELGSSTDNKLEELDGNSEKRFDELSENTDKRLDELRDNTDKKLSELSSDTDKRIEELEGSTDKKFEELSENTDNRIEELSENTDNKLSDLIGNTKNWISELGSNMEKRLEELGSSTNKMLEELSVNTDKMLSELSGNTDKRFAELSGDTEKKINELSGDTEKKLNELSGNTDKKLSELSGSTDKRFDELGSSTNKRLEELSGNTEKRFTELSDDTEKKLGLLSESTDRRFDQINENTDRRIKELSDDTAKKLSILGSDTDEKLSILGSDTDEKLNILSSDTDEKLSILSSDTDEKLCVLSSDTAEKFNEISSVMDLLVDGLRNDTMSELIKLSESTDEKITALRDEGVSAYVTSGDFAEIQATEASRIDYLYSFVDSFEAFKGEINQYKQTIEEEFSDMKRDLENSISDAKLELKKSISEMEGTIVARLSASEKEMLDKHNSFVNEQNKKNSELENKIAELERKNQELTGIISSMEVNVTNVYNLVEASNQELQLARPSASSITPFDQVISWEDADAKNNNNLDVEKVRGYRIYRSNNEDMNDAINISDKAASGLSSDKSYVSVNTYSVTDTGLSPSTTYYYWVTTLIDDNMDGVIDRENTYRSASTVLTSTTTALSTLQPGSVSISEDVGALKVSWKDADRKYVGGYNVYLCKGAYYGSPGSELVDKKIGVTDNLALFYNLSSGTTYYATVRSVLNSGYSADGEIEKDTGNRSNMTTVSDIYFQPVNVTARMGGGGDDIIVSWSPGTCSEYVDYYVIKYGVGNYNSVATSVGCGITLTGLARCTTYDIMVNAHVRSGELAEYEVANGNTTSSATSYQTYTVEIKNSTRNKSGVGSIETNITYLDSTGTSRTQTTSGTIYVKQGSTISYVTTGINAAQYSSYAVNDMLGGGDRGIGTAILKQGSNTCNSDCTIRVENQCMSKNDSLGKVIYTSKVFFQ